jgi:TolA-binding protein
MPRCPECKEPVEKGQTHCFACGTDFIPPPTKSNFFKSSAVFIVAVAGGCIIAVVLALMLARPKTKATSKVNESPESVKPFTQTSAPVKPKEATQLNDIATFSQQMADLETKISTIEKRARTEQFTKDETDALRFAQNLRVEMQSLLQSMKNAKSNEEQKRFARQFRMKQNEIESFLIILKNRL